MRPGTLAGGVARHWRRAGHRGGPADGDTARGQRLYAQLAGVPFWCEQCGGTHPLAEHAACRAGHARAILAEALGPPGGRHA